MQLQTKFANPITLQEFADILEESTLNETLDLGSAVIHKVTHRTRGALALVSTSGGACAVMAL